MTTTRGSGAPKQSTRGRTARATTATTRRGGKSDGSGKRPSEADTPARQPGGNGRRAGSGQGSSAGSSTASGQGSGGGQGSTSGQGSGGGQGSTPSSPLRQGRTPRSLGPQSPAGRTQRQHILDTALTLMAARGVDGVSMRDLAAATKLNVASLYHYFPSKRDLLVAVLEERGLMEELASGRQPSLTRDPAGILTDLLDDILHSMLDVEDFIRLMFGEALRGDQTALSVGSELLGAAQSSIEQWLADTQPDLCTAAGPAATARMLRAMIIGTFLEYVTGVMEDAEDPGAALTRRAGEAAAVLRARV